MPTLRERMAGPSDYDRYLTLYRQLLIDRMRGEQTNVTQVQSDMALRVALAHMELERLARNLTPEQIARARATANGSIRVREVEGVDARNLDGNVVVGIPVGFPDDRVNQSCCIIQ